MDVNSISGLADAQARVASGHENHMATRDQSTGLKTVYAALGEAACGCR